jgi:hypothetical protein
MAKTLEKFCNGPDEPRAILLLDALDLHALGVIERDYSRGWKFNRDPAEAFRALLDYETKAATRVIMESGLVEVIVAALERFKEWAKAAREMKKAPLGIWMDEVKPQPTMTRVPGTDGAGRPNEIET